mmetsp:Transcript_27245/g.49488  ORF Transcript_27245/g.49488 Transcript_27245/m.49488 type:complete len:444 (-) Transcript_27245:195-1526(-)
MRAARASLLLLQFSSHPSECSSSSFGRIGDVSPHAFRKPSSHRGNGKRYARDVALRLLPRGGQQGGTPTYHGNYVSSSAGEEPKGAVLPAVVQTTSATAAATTTTTTTPAPAPPAVVLSSATSTGSKLANLRERTGPAVVMLGATYLLLKYTGNKGFLGLVFLIQLKMYQESTSVVENYKANSNNNNNNNNGGASLEDDGIGSYELQKWWWFATAVMATTGRKMISDNTSWTMDRMNLITFGMSSVSLLWAVIQLAAIDSPSAEAIYRSYLAKVASCHFSLLFLVGQSSFWIRTVSDYGLVWILFPALLVIVNDTMAYVFGVLVGKRKLIPRLSPKKTVEGFVGAGVSTMAVAAPLLKKMMGGGDGATSSTENLGRHAVILALYVSFVSPFGGFLASATKRAHGAKDFGNFIPGHGGAVDRFDCQVVTAPFVYLYLKNCLSSE